MDIILRGCFHKPFTTTHRYTFKESYSGCAALLMSRFWHICSALGQLPGKISNQSWTVINISARLSHATTINVLIIDAAKLLCNLCETVTIFLCPLALGLLNGPTYSFLFGSLIKHTFLFSGARNIFQYALNWSLSSYTETVPALLESMARHFVSQGVHRCSFASQSLNRYPSFRLAPVNFSSISFCLPQYLTGQYHWSCLIRWYVPSLKLYFGNYDIINQSVWRDTF